MAVRKRTTRVERFSPCDDAQIYELYSQHSEHIAEAWRHAPFAVLVDTPVDVYVFGVDVTFLERYAATSERARRKMLNEIEVELVEHVLWCWYRHRELGEPPMPLFVIITNGDGTWRSSVAHGVVMQRGGQA